VSTVRTQNFFALADKPLVLRLPVNQGLQRQLSELFAKQTTDFVGDGLEEVPFDGRLVPDESQILIIRDFPVPAEIWEAVRDPKSCDPLRLGSNESEIRALFTGALGDHPTLSVQSIGRRQLISRDGFSIINAADTFKKLEEPGLILDTGLVAYYGHKKLYFRSYHLLKRVFDLTSFYREATDKDLDSFLSTPGVHFSEDESLFSNADAWVRRKIASIRDSKILSKESPSKIAAAAKRFGLELQVRRVRGRSVLVFPDGKKELKVLLRFLDEDYYSAPVTGTHFVSNSKYKVE
jgi:Domain of unknown function (DUF4868)